MAVKPEQIKARLKVLFPKANLSQKRLDAIAAKLCQKPADDADDDAIDEVLRTADEYHSFEDIAKDDDRIRTLESKPTPPADPPAPPVNDPSDDAPAWAVKLMEKVDKLEKGKETESKQTLASQAMAKSSLPESFKSKWVNRIDLNSEVSFEDQVKALEDEHSELVQTIADNTSTSGPAPSGGAKGAPSDAELDAAVSSL